jgi:hypothetical protein
MRERKPCVLARRRLRGWYVRLGKTILLYGLATVRPILRSGQHVLDASAGRWFDFLRQRELLTAHAAILNPQVYATLPGGSRKSGVRLELEETEKPRARFVVRGHAGLAFLQTSRVLIGTCICFRGRLERKECADEDFGILNLIALLLALFNS